MTIRYQNTFRDLLSFCFHHYPCSPIMLGFFGIWFIFLSFAIIQQLPEEAGLAVKVLVFIVLQCILFAAISGFFAVVIVLSVVSRRNKTFLTEHAYTLEENGFTSETPYAKSEQKCAIVQKLARTKNYIFICVAQHAAHVIPRRACRDDAEWEAFYAYCRQKTGRT